MYLLAGCTTPSKDQPVYSSLFVYAFIRKFIISSKYSGHSDRCQKDLYTLKCKRNNCKHNPSTAQFRTFLRKKFGAIQNHFFIEHNLEYFRTF